MKKLLLLLFFSGTACAILNGQPSSDSLVFYRDLSFHSDLERSAFIAFLSEHRKAFPLFMAIEPEVQEEEVMEAELGFQSIVDELRAVALASKKVNKTIKTAYGRIHQTYLRKYDELQFFPALFKQGVYNCASASMLYALAFEGIGVPYKVMVSSSHVYLVANPGEKSVVIETTNPSLEKAIFSGEFKAQYVNYLRQSKQISEAEYKGKSTEEIFEENYNAVREGTFLNLPGIQYYNKGYEKIQENELEEAFALLQKAYFFFPDNRVKVLLHNTCLALIERSDFRDVEEIDYLSQYARFDPGNQDFIVGVFGNIIQHFAQYTDQEEHCRLLHDRLQSHLDDPRLCDEIRFSYNLRMSVNYSNSKRREDYITSALAIKDNHRDANLLFEYHVRNKLSEISQYPALLDSIRILEEKYPYPFIQSVYDSYRSMAWLRIAEEEIDNQRPKACEQYLAEFEERSPRPIQDEALYWTAERVYRKLAVHYYYRNRSLAKKTVDRGLQFVPESAALKSVTH
ncbi:MAG: hypothetical protein R2751_08585 [Bacteroidales bacterium]